MTSSNKKDYYRILGVQEDADELVIRAAYLALLKRYNLDDWKGDDKQRAVKMLADINEAYSVLKDRHERLEYNSSRQKQQVEEVKSVDSNMSPEEVEAAWQVACNYYPDLQELFSNLHKISEQVAEGFKVSVLSFKDYPNRNKLAAKFELDYLKRQFGDNEDLIEFGRELLLEGAKDAVAELHHVINVMGKSVNSDEVIHNISEKYQTGRYFQELEEIEKERQFELKKQQYLEEERQAQERKLKVLARQQQESIESAKAALRIFGFILLVAFFGGIYFFNKPSQSSNSAVAESQYMVSREKEKIADFGSVSVGEFIGAGDGSNVFLKIIKKDEEFWAELTTVAMPELRTPAGEPVYCSGEVAGKLDSSSSNENLFILTKKLYEGTSSNESCTIKFTRLIHADGYSVDESNCTMYHGMRCGFSSSYLARKL